MVFAFTVLTNLAHAAGTYGYPVFIPLLGRLASVASHLALCLVEMLIIMISMPVCLSVCLSARVSQKHMSILNDCLYM